ncbi:Depudecin biosynthesis cluster-specific transcription activator DEP6-like protein [Cladobotryum mycophilum]|uniref:Depudecin biosynthesis cluster-specific transcription activator DEP6-like protein n=1 Tax=Cladobotryum mycophilum TaxID=491253 RepID=A0ABR0T3W5_9HYPO
MSATVAKNTPAPSSAGTASHSTGQARSEPTPSSVQRLSCEECRVHKTRCDRNDPQCSRCAKMCLPCYYSNHAKPTFQTDMSRAPMTFDNRISTIAEQGGPKLATSNHMMMPPSHHQQPAMQRAGTDMGPTFAAPPAVMGSSSNVSPLQWSAPPGNMVIHGLQTPGAGVIPEQVMVQQSVTGWSNQTSLDVSGFQSFDTPAVCAPDDLLMKETLPDGGQPFDPNSIVFDPTSQFVPCISADITTLLHNQFFDVFYPVMPVVNKTRFQNELLHQFPSVEVQTLSHSISALAALSAPEFRCYADQYYEQGRILLDICERHESGDSLISINILQAAAVLTLYELKRPNFARAYITLGRAIRIARVMGLDRGPSNPGIGSRWGLRTPMPEPMSSAVEEENRRTFWLLYMFDVFTSLESQTTFGFDNMNHIPLPNPSEYTGFAFDGSMPSIRHVFETLEVPPTSPFAATVIMITLHRRCADHLKASSTQASYNFGDIQFAITKAIDHCRYTLLSAHMTGANRSEQLSLVMRINLDAVEIILHDAALVRIENGQWPANVPTNSAAKCMMAATDIVTAIQMGQSLTGHALAGFEQLDRFLAWPMATAIQVCLRMLDRNGEVSLQWVNFLRILSSAMRKLILPEHVAPGLLERVDARIAGAGR